MIIDAHVHLWKTQRGSVNGKPVVPLGGGRTDFGGEVRQMLPPYLANGENPAEILLSNMDFAGVNGAVVTQEQIDGSQDEYLREVRQNHPDRFRVSCLYEEGKPLPADGFDGVKICAGRLADPDLLHHEYVFSWAAESGRFLLIDLAEGDNVRIESGGITWLYNSEFWPYPSAVKAFRDAIDAVGAEKLMWGSDYPRTMTAITYRMSLDFLRESDALTEREKTLILGENARTFYGFPDLPPVLRIRHMAED